MDSKAQQLMQYGEPSSWNGEDSDLYQQISQVTRSYEQQLKKIREKNNESKTSNLASSSSSPATGAKTKRLEKQIRQKHDDLGNRLSEFSRHDPAKSLKIRKAKMPASAPSSRRSSFSKSSGSTKAQEKLPKEPARQVRALERKHGQNIKTAKQAVTKGEEVTFEGAGEGVSSAKTQFQQSVTKNLGHSANSIGEDVEGLVQQTRSKLTRLVHEDMERRLQEIEAENVAKSGDGFARLAIETVERAHNLVQDLEDQLEEENDRHFQHLESQMKGELEKFIHSSAEAIEQGYQAERKELCERTEGQMDEQIRELIDNMDSQEREYREYLQEIKEKETEEKLKQLREDYGNRLFKEREEYERKLKQEHEQKLEDMEETLQNEHHNAIADLERRLQDDHQRNMQRKADNALKQYEKEVADTEKKLRREMETEERQMLRKIRAEHEGQRQSKVEELQNKLQQEMARTLEQEQEKLAEEEREIFAKVRKEAEAATQQEIEKLRDSNSGNVAATVASLTASMEEERANRIAEIMREHNEAKDEAVTKTKEEIAEEFERREQRLRESFEKEREEAIAKAQQDEYEKMNSRLESRKNNIQDHINQEIATKRAEWTQLRRQAEKELEQMMEALESGESEFLPKEAAEINVQDRRGGLRHEPFSPDSDSEGYRTPSRQYPATSQSVDHELVNKFEDTLKKMNKRYDVLIHEHSNTETKLAKVAKEVVQLRKKTKMAEQREKELKERLGIARSLTSATAFADESREEGSVKMSNDHAQSYNHSQSDLNRTDSSWYEMCQKLYKANEELISRLHSHPQQKDSPQSKSAERRHSVQYDRQFRDNSGENNAVRNVGRNTDTGYSMQSSWTGPLRADQKPGRTWYHQNKGHSSSGVATDGTLGYAKQAIEQALSKTTHTAQHQDNSGQQYQESRHDIPDTESHRTYSTVSDTSPEREKTGVGRLAGSSGPIYQKGSSSGNTFGWDGTKGGSLDASPSPGEPPSLNTSASSVDSYVQRAKERLADYIGTSNWNQQGGSGGTKAVSFGLAKRNQDQQQHQLDLDDWLPIRRTNEDSNARLAAAEEKHTGRSAQAKQRGRSSPSRSLRRTTVSTEMKRSPKAVKKRSSSAKGKLKKPTSPQFSVSKKKRCQSQILGT
eukprot:gb/GECG01008229.1/.p1 GENE.gb/GECG01008229.1/~~gb/GECG01008229.1/.p1  ORF type:complete len:1139 (+),score=241.57 gb/GECG01008229.1/:1-3417(+)